MLKELYEKRNTLWKEYNETRNIETLVELIKLENAIANAKCDLICEIVKIYAPDEYPVIAQHISRELNELLQVRSTRNQVGK